MVLIGRVDWSSDRMGALLCLAAWRGCRRESRVVGAYPSCIRWGGAICQFSGHDVEWLSQTKAAKLVGVDQPTLSKLLDGGAKGFSLDRLVEMVSALGYDVDINVRPPTAAPSTTGRIGFGRAAERIQGICGDDRRPGRSFFGDEPYVVK